MRIGAGWKKKDKNNDTYLSCKIDIPLLGTLSFAMFANKDKQNDNQPDYVISWGQQKNNDEVPF